MAKTPLVTHEIGERIRTGDGLLEVAEAADTRWGSRTYRLSPIEPGLGERKRWLTPRKVGRLAPYIDGASIGAFVRAFYAHVQKHESLAPVFASRVDDWEPHLARMTHFWSAVLLAAPGFQGNPMQKHRELELARPEHFPQWLALFEEVLGEIFTEEMTAIVVARATRIGARLSGAMFGAGAGDAAHALR